MRLLRILDARRESLTPSTRVAQYDGAVAYTLDSCIQNIFTAIEGLGLTENTIVVLTADHGETLDEHDCWFDHHGTYDNTLHVPLIIRYPGKMPTGKRIGGYTRLMDIVPTILDLAGIEVEDKFDGDSLVPMAHGHKITHAPDFYFTECTWNCVSTAGRNSRVEADSGAGAGLPL